MATMLPIAEDVAAAATHGQYCPKMCTFACPVAEATGRDDAVPWSFHREVADLAAGRQEPSAVGDRLTLCNGCLACRDACTYEQDVPGQVVAARAALADVDIVPEAARVWLGNLRDGKGIDGGALPHLPDDDEDATLAFVVQHDDTARSLTALRTLATRAGVAARFVRGGGVAAARLRALGLRREAAAAAADLAEALVGVTTVVVTDGELLGPVRMAAPEGTRLFDLASWVLDRMEAGVLLRSTSPALGNVTFHDPPALARRGGSTNAPRQVLRLLGGVVVEPEGHGPKTVSAGPGLAMEILAPEAVSAVAERRAAQLLATGAPIVTTGGAELTALRSTGTEVTDLAVLLASRTQGRSAPTPKPEPGTLPPPAPQD